MHASIRIVFNLSFTVVSCSIYWGFYRSIFRWALFPNNYWITRVVHLKNLKILCTKQVTFIYHDFSTLCKYVRSYSEMRLHSTCFTTMTTCSQGHFGNVVSLFIHKLTLTHLLFVVCTCPKGKLKDSKLTKTQK